MQRFWLFISLQPLHDWLYQLFFIIDGIGGQWLLYRHYDWNVILLNIILVICFWNFAAEGMKKLLVISNNPWNHFSFRSFFLNLRQICILFHLIDCLFYNFKIVKLLFIVLILVFDRFYHSDCFTKLFFSVLNILLMLSIYFFNFWSHHLNFGSLIYRIVKSIIVFSLPRSSGFWSRIKIINLLNMINKSSVTYLLNLQGVKLDPIWPRRGGVSIVHIQNLLGLGMSLSLLNRREKILLLLYFLNLLSNLRLLHVLVVVMVECPLLLRWR